MALRRHEMKIEVAQLDGGRVKISTTRLTIRPAQRDDAEHLAPTFADFEVMRYWSEPAHKSIQRTREWINIMVEGEQNGVTDFIICLKPDLIPIGKIGVWQGEEIGFLLSRSHWRQGLGLEALNGILTYLFRHRDIGYITSDVDPRNVASISMLKKVGFEQYAFKEKSMEIGGAWVDSLYLKLDKQDWVSNNEKQRS